MKKLLAPLVIAASLFASPALAARWVSVASGNIGTAATWGTVDSASYLNGPGGGSEGVAGGVTSGPVASTQWTTTAITVTQVGIKIASRAAAPGGADTLTIKLANATSPGTNECSATIKITDLPTASSTQSNGGGQEGGWVFVACAASLTSGQNYDITLSTSTASGSVSAWAGTGTNWDRIIVTSTTGTPAAGDQLFLAGLTASGLLTARTVTMDATALVNYGNVANTPADPSISISNGGTLAFAATASTNFVFEHAGPMVIYNGGTFTIGTSGTPIPSTSTAIYTQNSTVEADTGLDVRNGGTFNAVGVSGGRTVVHSKLTTTANAAATSLTVADNTGWLNGDSLVVAPTNLGGTQSDPISMTAGPGTTSLTVGALAFQHTAISESYTAGNGTAYSTNFFPDVIDLTRNVTIKGSGTTTNGYIHFQNTSHTNMDWVALNMMSGATGATGKRGLEVDVANTPTGAGTFSLTHFAFVNSHGATMMFFISVNTAGSQTGGGVSGTPVLVQHGVFYNVVTDTSTAGNLYGLFIGVTYNPFSTFDDLTFTNVGGGSFQDMVIKTGAMNVQFTNITVAGSGRSDANPAITLAPQYSAGRSVIGASSGNAWGPIETYSNRGLVWGQVGSGLCLSGLINGFKSWKENGNSILTAFEPPATSCGGITYDQFFAFDVQVGLFFSSGTANSGGGTATFKNGFIGFASTFAGQNQAFQSDGISMSLILDNMDLCPNGLKGSITFVGCQKVFSTNTDTAGGTGTVPTGSQIILRNTSIDNNYVSNNLLWNIANSYENWWMPQAYIVQDCAACAVKHDAVVPGGFLSYDTANPYPGSSYSLNMRPHINTLTGSISGTSLTRSSGDTLFGDLLTNNSTLAAGTVLTAGSASGPWTTSISQTVGSSQFQSYVNVASPGNLLRMQSAPYGRGPKIGVASGATASVCFPVRPSISTDGAPPWGGSAVTYNGDTPRLINRANPEMGVASDTPLTVTYTPALTAGAWSVGCASLPAAPNDGAWEVVVDADQTFTSNAGGWVDVGPPSCTNCLNINSMQAWWNGLPIAAIDAASTGGGGFRPGLN